MEKTVVLGITSGIAAYKTLDLVKELKNDDIDVFVVMTDAARKMVNPKEFEEASGNKVYVDLFESDFDYKDILKIRKVDHIDLADRADVICIAPATANVIAKIAYGIADDFLTTMVLASNSPIILCPSMNVHMWNNPVTQENIEKLKKRGFIILLPARGPLACGYEGTGRLPHILAIKEEIMRQILYSKSLTGKQVIVTAGATREKIDDVRFITNNASGKMGAAIADECHLRGAEVVLLRATNAVEPRYVMQQEMFESIEDLQGLVKKYVGDANIVIHTAAVGDFRIAKKKGKTSSKKTLSLELHPTIKVSDEIRKWNPKVKLILFKAEHGLSEDALIKQAKDKLRKSKADAVVANDVSGRDRGFASETNEVIIVTQKETKKLSLAPKQEIARRIIEYVIPVIASD